MSSTLNPTAQPWTPAPDTKTKIKAKSSVAPSTPSTFSHNAQPFVPWPHHEFYPLPYNTYSYIPQAPEYFYPRPAFQEGPVDQCSFFGGDQGLGQSCDMCDSIDAQDPFARQLRQVTSLKAGGYYPVWGGRSNGGGEGGARDDDGSWGAGRRGHGDGDGDTWVGGDASWDTGKTKNKNKKSKKYKGRKGMGGWMSREVWQEMGMRGKWKTKEEWDQSQKCWEEKKKDREARKDSGVEVDVGVNKREDGGEE